MKTNSKSSISPRAAPPRAGTAGPAAPCRHRRRPRGGPWRSPPGGRGRGRARRPGGSPRGGPAPRQPSRPRGAEGRDAAAPPPNRRRRWRSDAAGGQSDAAAHVAGRSNAAPAPPACRPLLGDAQASADGGREGSRLARPGWRPPSEQAAGGTTGQSAGPVGRRESVLTPPGTTTPSRQREGGGACAPVPSSPGQPPAPRDAGPAAAIGCGAAPGPASDWPRPAARRFPAGGGGGEARWRRRAERGRRR